MMLFIIKSSVHRFCESIFNTPSASEAFTQSTFAHTYLSSPLRNIKSDTIESDGMVSTGVVILDYSSSPKTVIFTISKRAINTLNGMLLGRSSSHIGNKDSEIEPLITNTDTLGTVQSISSGIGIITSLAHSFPYRVLRIFTHAVTSPILLLQATAGGCITVGERTGNNANNIAAGAFTLPINILTSSLILTKYSESVKRLIAQVSRFTHNAFLVNDSRSRSIAQ